MNEDKKNTQAQSQQEGQQGGTDQPAERTFTQADVDRIVNNRLARQKQDLEAADQYRRERDDARQQLEQYKNDAFLKEKGVKEQYRAYVSFEAGKMVGNGTDFNQAVEKFLQQNPVFAGRGFRVVSTGISNTSNGDGGNGDADIRKAMGLKG